MTYYVADASAPLPPFQTLCLNMAMKMSSPSDVLAALEAAQNVTGKASSHGRAEEDGADMLKSKRAIARVKREAREKKGRLKT